jgi:hypothetical protein
MPHSTADARPAGKRFETPGPLFTAAPPAPALDAACDGHGSGNSDKTTTTPTPTPTTPAALPLPPTLTPATTTIQSVPVGVLSTLQAVSDLSASTGSLPSTTTTLTNTLPPTQSAALRALNAPAFQSQASSHVAKSTSSRTTLSSQPVVVRTYSGARHGPRHSSGPTSPRHPAMNGHPSQRTSALSAGLARHTERLPSLDDFSFSAVLRAVDPEIRDAIDAIAQICARSRMSLADEYDAHLPPQGEITGTGPGWAAGVGALVNRGRIPRTGQVWSAAENPLTAVPEASSSSEKLASESRGSTSAGGKKRSQSAYGSLKSFISGGSGRRKSAAAALEHAETGASGRTEALNSHGPAWSVNTSSPSHPAITIVTSPQASNQLSLDTSSTITDIPEQFEDVPAPRPHTAIARQVPSHRRHVSLVSLPSARTPSSTLSSLASWLSWSRHPNSDSASQQEATQAEARLREMLILTQDSNLGRTKAPLSVG